MPKADDAATGFYNNIGTSTQVWFKNFNNGDIDSHELHWHHTLDELFADTVDFAWWGGQGYGVPGGPGCIAFFKDFDPFMGGKQPCDYLYWSEIEWGNDDMDWVVVQACKFLNGNLGDLCVMARGIHLICGYRTESYDYNDGKYFADRLQDVACITIKNAWFATCNEYQPSGTIARVFGGDYCVNDSIIDGGGPILVTRDPTPSSGYACWDFLVR